MGVSRAPRDRNCQAQASAEGAGVKESPPGCDLDSKEGRPVKFEYQNSSQYIFSISII